MGVCRYTPRDRNRNRHAGRCDRHSGNSPGRRGARHRTSRDSHCTASHNANHPASAGKWHTTVSERDSADRDTACSRARRPDRTATATATATATGNRTSRDSRCTTNNTANNTISCTDNRTCRDTR